MKGRLKIALASIFVSVLLAEALLRLMPSEIEESSGAPLRYFWSENYLIAASNGAIRGKPNSQVREAATCNGDVEFDVRFYTNNLGFIDDLDYKADRRYQRVFAVVGDSYTAGTGALPWIPKLRKALQKSYPEAQIYNLGFVGTGIMQFAALVAETAAQLAITDVVVLAISDDFGRPLWRPVSDEQGMWFCKATEDDGECRSQKPHVTLVDIKTSRAEILRFGSTPPGMKHKIDPRIQDATETGVDHQVEQVWKGPIRAAIKRSHLLGRLNAFRHKVLSQLRGRFGNLLPANFQENYSALQQLKEGFPNITFHFVQLPSKMDAHRGYYLTELRSHIEALTWRYTDLWQRCDFPLALYHRCDHHFTEVGYEALADCFRKHVLESSLKG